MSRPVLLLISYHFPPDEAIGGARPYRFYKYLKRLGYECHVLTASRQEAGADTDVEYVPDPLRIRPHQGFWWQAERITWKFLLRAELVLGWAHAVRQAGQSFLNSRKESRITILSSAPPVGPHLAAMRLAFQSGYPWIADFRDPIHTVTGERANLQGMIAPALEGLILSRADAVLANTDAMRERWIGRHSGLREKIHVLWNGFDPEDVIQPYPLPRRERKVVSHVGELYGGRSIRPILYALQRLFDAGRLSYSGVCIRQVGPTEPAELPDAKFLDDARTRGWLELKEPVPAKEARALALDSDGLLLVQPHTAVQVPGKLFDYLRMGRPILAFIVRGSPVENILQKSCIPHVCIYPEHSPEVMAARLREFFGMLGGELVSPSSWFQENFEAPRQTETLHRLIRTLYDNGEQQ